MGNDNVLMSAVRSAEFKDRRHRADKPQDLKIVTVFWQPKYDATGYVYKDKWGKRYWQIGGAGIGGKTPMVEVPFQIPHDDFASAIARAYFLAIYESIDGSKEQKMSRALDICFNYKMPKAEKSVPVLPEDVKIPESDLRKIARYLSGGRSSDPDIVGGCYTVVYCEVAVGQYPSDSEAWHMVQTALGESHKLVKKFNHEHRVM